MGILDNYANLEAMPLEGTVADNDYRVETGIASEDMLVGQPAQIVPGSSNEFKKSVSAFDGIVTDTCNRTVGRKIAAGETVSVMTEGEVYVATSEPLVRGDFVTVDSAAGNFKKGAVANAVGVVTKDSKDGLVRMVISRKDAHTFAKAD